MVSKILKIWSGHLLSSTFKMIKQPRPGIINSRWTKEMLHPWDSISVLKQSRKQRLLLFAVSQKLGQAHSRLWTNSPESGLEATVQRKAKYLTSDPNGSPLSGDFPEPCSQQTSQYLLAVFNDTSNLPSDSAVKQVSFTYQPSAPMQNSCLQ